MVIIAIGLFRNLTNESHKTDQLSKSDIVKPPAVHATPRTVVQ
ncbi:conserved hypothetical protein, partial [Listeria monocytogenes FSL F2-208]